MSRRSGRGQPPSGDRRGGAGDSRDRSEQDGPAYQPTQGMDSDGAPLPFVPGVALTERLGAGGMGVVYRGRQVKLRRTVAVKLLGTELRGGAAERRFLQECQNLARLEHRNIVVCFDSGLTEDGEPYMVMEFVDGSNLSDWVRANGPLGVHDALHLIRDLSDALMHGLERRTIHRDVKPENVLLKHDPHPRSAGFPFLAKLADFGLSRCEELHTGEVRMTQIGEVWGSPLTMAPEQYEGLREVDFRADLYALGCILFYVLTARHAFQGLPMEVLRVAKLKGPVPDVRALRPDLPEGVQTLVKDMLAIDPAARPESYAALIARIDKLLGSGTLAVAVTQPLPEARGGRRWMRIAIPAAVAGLAATTWLVLQALDGDVGQGGRGRRDGRPGVPTVRFVSAKQTVAPGDRVEVRVDGDDPETPEGLRYNWSLLTGEERGLETPISNSSTTWKFTAPEVDPGATFTIKVAVSCTDEDDNVSDSARSEIVVQHDPADPQLAPGEVQLLLVGGGAKALPTSWAGASSLNIVRKEEKEELLTLRVPSASGELSRALPPGPWRIEGLARIARGGTKPTRLDLELILSDGAHVGFALAGRDGSADAEVDLSSLGGPKRGPFADDTAIDFAFAWDRRTLTVTIRIEEDPSPIVLRPARILEDRGRPRRLRATVSGADVQLEKLRLVRD